MGAQSGQGAHLRTALLRLDERAVLHDVLVRVLDEHVKRYDCTRSNPVIAHPYSFTKHPSPCRAYLVAPGLDEAFVLRRRNDPANHTGTKTVGVPLGPVGFEYP